MQKMISGKMSKGKIIPDKKLPSMEGKNVQIKIYIFSGEKKQADILEKVRAFIESFLQQFSAIELDSQIAKTAAELMQKYLISR